MSQKSSSASESLYASSILGNDSTISSPERFRQYAPRGPSLGSSFEDPTLLDSRTSLSSNETPVDLDVSTIEKIKATIDSNVFASIFPKFSPSTAMSRPKLLRKASLNKSSHLDNSTGDSREIKNSFKAPEVNHSDSSMDKSDIAELSQKERKSKRRKVAEPNDSISLTDCSTNQENLGSSPSSKPKVTRKRKRLQRYNLDNLTESGKELAALTDSPVKGNLRPSRRNLPRLGLKRNLKKHSIDVNTLLSKTSENSLQDSVENDAASVNERDVSSRKGNRNLKIGLKKHSINVQDLLVGESSVDEQQISEHCLDRSKSITKLKPMKRPILRKHSINVNEFLTDSIDGSKLDEKEEVPDSDQPKQKIVGLRKFSVDVNSLLKVSAEGDESLATENNVSDRSKDALEEIAEEGDLQDDGLANHHAEEEQSKNNVPDGSKGALEEIEEGELANYHTEKVHSDVEGTLQTCVEDSDMEIDLSIRRCNVLSLEKSRSKCGDNMTVYEEEMDVDETNLTPSSQNSVLKKDKSLKRQSLTSAGSSPRRGKKFESRIKGRLSLQRHSINAVNLLSSISEGTSEVDRRTEIDSSLKLKSLDVDCDSKTLINNEVTLIEPILSKTLYVPSVSGEVAEVELNPSGGSSSNSLNVSELDSVSGNSAQSVNKGSSKKKRRSTYDLFSLKKLEKFSLKTTENVVLVEASDSTLEKSCDMVHSKREILQSSVQGLECETSTSSKDTSQSEKHEENNYKEAHTLNETYNVEVSDGQNEPIRDATFTLQKEHLLDHSKIKILSPKVSEGSCSHENDTLGQSSPEKCTELKKLVDVIGAENQEARQGGEVSKIKSSDLEKVEEIIRSESCEQKNRTNNREVQHPEDVSKSMFLDSENVAEKTGAENREEKNKAENREEKNEAENQVVQQQDVSKSTFPGLEKVTEIIGTEIITEVENQVLIPIIGVENHEEKNEAENQGVQHQDEVSKNMILDSEKVAEVIGAKNQELIPITGVENCEEKNETQQREEVSKSMFVDSEKVAEIVDENREDKNETENQEPIPIIGIQSHERENRGVQQLEEVSKSVFVDSEKVAEIIGAENREDKNETENQEPIPIIENQSHEIQNQGVQQQEGVSKSMFVDSEKVAEIIGAENREDDNETENQEPIPIIENQSLEIQNQGVQQQEGVSKSMFVDSEKVTEIIGAENREDENETENQEPIPIIRIQSHEVENQGVHQQEGVSKSMFVDSEKVAEIIGAENHEDENETENQDTIPIIGIQSHEVENQGVYQQEGVSKSMFVDSEKVAEIIGAENQEPIPIIENQSHEIENQGVQQQEEVSKSMFVDSEKVAEMIGAENREDGTANQEPILIEVQCHETENQVVQQHKVSKSVDSEKVAEIAGENREDKNETENQELIPIIRIQNHEIENQRVQKREEITKSMFVDSEKAAEIIGAENSEDKNETEIQNGIPTIRVKSLEAKDEIENRGVQQKEEVSKSVSPDSEKMAEIIAENREEKTEAENQELIPIIGVQSREAKNDTVNREVQQQEVSMSMPPDSERIAEKIAENHEKMNEAETQEVFKVPDFLEVNEASTKRLEEYGNVIEVELCKLDGLDSGRQESNKISRVESNTGEKEVVGNNTPEGFNVEVEMESENSKKKGSRNSSSRKDTEEPRNRRVKRVSGTKRLSGETSEVLQVKAPSTRTSVNKKSVPSSPDIGFGESFKDPQMTLNMSVIPPDSIMSRVKRTRGTFHSTPLVRKKRAASLKASLPELAAVCRSAAISTSPISVGEPHLAVDIPIIEPDKLKEVRLEENTLSSTTVNRVKKKVKCRKSVTFAKTPPKSDDSKTFVTPPLTPKEPKGVKRKRSNLVDISLMKKTTFESTTELSTISKIEEQKHSKRIYQSTPMPKRRSSRRDSERQIDKKCISIQVSRTFHQSTSESRVKTRSGTSLGETGEGELSGYEASSGTRMSGGISARIFSRDSATEYEPVSGTYYPSRTDYSSGGRTSITIESETASVPSSPRRVRRSKIKTSEGSMDDESEITSFNQPGSMCSSPVDRPPLSYTTNASRDDFEAGSEISASAGPRVSERTVQDSTWYESLNQTETSLEGRGPDPQEKICRRKRDSIFPSPKKKRYLRRVETNPTDGGSPYKQRRLPRLARWMNANFYKFLRTKLEPNFGLATRNEMEQFAAVLYSTVNIVVATERHFEVHMNHLKREMARLKLFADYGDYFWFLITYTPPSFQEKILPVGLKARDAEYNDLKHGHQDSFP